MQLRAEQRAIADRQAADRRAEKEVRRKAREQAARGRRQARGAKAVEREITSRPRRFRSDYEAWLDKRDARQPLTRADLHSQNDDIAARVVADGGGVQAVIDATELCTLENVTNLIDPAILKLVRQRPTQEVTASGTVLADAKLALSLREAPPLRRLADRVLALAQLRLHRSLEIAGRAAGTKREHSLSAASRSRAVTDASQPRVTRCNART
jgi:hypothetical protein